MINTIHVVPKRKYPHQTVSFRPSRSRIRTTRFHCSSSKKELELILEAGDLFWRSSEEELLGPVGGGSGWRVVGEEESLEGEVGVEETWRRERVLLRLRRDLIWREGITKSGHCC
jgi:hypothetical protein